jgi:hypothetical protein
MALSVTLPGSSGGIVTVQSGAGDHLFVAQIIANTILMASTSGGLNPPATVTIDGGAPIGPSPTPPDNLDSNILYMYGTGGTSYTVPSVYNYVVDLMTGPETITGSNVQVISYDSVGSAFDLSGTSSIAADPATDSDVVTVVSGVFNIATGNGNDTVTAIGSGTVGGGTGTNVFTITPSVGAGIRLQTNGLADSVTVNDATGTMATIVSAATATDLNLMADGAGTVYAQILSTDATVTGGPGTLDVSTGGSDAAVFGGTGPLIVTDSGTGDTIGAFGASPVTINAHGTDGLFFGGAGSITASLSGTAPQGHNSLRGGTGNIAATLAGGANDVFGGTGALAVDETGTNELVAAYSASTANVTLAGSASNDSVVGGSNAVAVTSDGSGGVIDGGTGALSVDDSGTGDTIGAFSATVANVSLLGGGGTAGTGELVIGGTGALNATVGGQYESVFGGSAATNVFIASIGVPSNADILAGTGSLTVNDQGQGDTIGSFGASPTDVTLGGSNDLLFGSSGTTNVSVSGSSDTIIAGTGALAVTASSAAVLFGNTGPLTFVGGVGASSIVAAPGGSSAVTVGSGGVTFWTGGNDTTSIVGGTGQTTLIGADGSSMFFSGSGGGLAFSAGDGNETLNASAASSNNVYGAGIDSLANDTIIGGIGMDTFIAGAGADSFVGGPNADSFAFFESVTSANASGAQDYVTNWTPSDSLFLIGYDTTQGQTASSVINSGTVANGSLTITLSDNTKITFNDVTDKSEFDGRVLYS